MKMPRISALLLLLIASPTITNGLITGTINIVGGAGGLQYLPGSYVNTFPRWTLDQDGQMKPLEGTEEGYNELNPNPFVNPSSTTEVWWPADIQTLQARPTLDILLKSGAMPTYAMAGLQVRVPEGHSVDGTEWKNFGMNCQPLASQWTAFQIAVENDFRVECFWGRAKMNVKSSSSSVSEEGEKDDSNAPTREIVDWHPFSLSSKNDDGVFEQKEIATQNTLKAINLLGEVLANLEETSPIASGMHILSIPVGGPEEWIDFPDIPPPPPPSEKEPSPPSFKLASVATSESDAKEMLNLDQDVLSITATSILNVDVSSIAPGSDSEYLPEVYKPLYLKK